MKQNSYCSILQYNTLKYSTVQYSTVQYSTTHQDSTVRLIRTDPNTTGGRFLPINRW